jgi:hypothetical protein
MNSPSPALAKDVDAVGLLLDRFEELIEVFGLRDVALHAGGVAPSCCTASSSSAWRRPVMKDLRALCDEELAPWRNLNRCFRR